MKNLSEQAVKSIEAVIAKAEQGQGNAAGQEIVKIVGSEVKGQVHWQIIAQFVEGSFKQASLKPEAKRDPDQRLQEVRMSLWTYLQIVEANSGDDTGALCRSIELAIGDASTAHQEALGRLVACVAPEGGFGGLGPGRFPDMSTIPPDCAPHAQDVTRHLENLQLYWGLWGRNDCGHN